MTDPLDHPAEVDSTRVGPEAVTDAEPPTASAPDARRRSVGPLQLAIATVAVLSGAALFLSGFSLGARTATTPGTPADEAALFAPFWDAWDSITRSYVGEVDRQELVQGAIDGMIGALDDPFSSYMSPEELQQQREMIGGEFSGVGAEVTTRSTEDEGACDTIGPTCLMVIVAPIDGSPAARAGLRSDDVIIAVDGRSVDGETLDEATARIRGPKGSAVTLTIEREGGRGFDVSIVRDTIVQRQVDSRDLAGGAVTYIELAGISDNAADQLQDVLRDARARGVEKFVIDLRDNPGGFVTGARSIASQFIAEGPIFWEEGADGSQVATNAAAGGLATGSDVRVAVLVNGGTASASEIIAGALQDTGRGTLVGQTTFGKGTIQQWIDLTAESGGFRLSIARWLTPEKRWIHEEGLVPDVAVPESGPGTSEPGPTGDPFIEAALDTLGEAAASDELAPAA
jgi:carboxyl-terminal processing protease